MLRVGGVATRPLTPVDVLRLQRLVGNQATVRVLAGGRSPGATNRIQRGDDDDKPKTPAKTESASPPTTVPKNVAGSATAVGNVVGNVVGKGLAKGLKVAEGGPVGEAGAALTVAASFASTAITTYELVTAIHEAMTPKTEAEHSQALVKAGNAVKGLHDQAWGANSSATSLASAIHPTAHTGSIATSTLASVAALPAAYLGFATNLVGTAEKLTLLESLEQLQFSDWNNPKAALARADAEVAAAEESVTANRLAADAAVDLTRKQLEAQAAVSVQLTKLETSRQKALSSPEGRMAARNPDMPTVEEAYANDIERWTAWEKDSRAAYVQSVEAKKQAQAALAVSDAYLEAAKEKKASRETFKKAVEDWAAEQQKGGKKADADPEGRYVPLEEIWHYAMGRVKVGAARKGVATAAAVIGLVGGIVTLALGWTPVGWALAATAGAIALGFVGWKLGKAILRKTGILGKSNREVYAERLWRYAKLGYDEKEPSKSDEQVRKNQRSNALSLLKALGLGWTLKDIDDTSNEKAAIANIAAKMKAG